MRRPIGLPAVMRYYPITNPNTNLNPNLDPDPNPTDSNRPTISNPKY